MATTKLKHTPGPWEVSIGNEGSIFGDLDNNKHNGDNPYIGKVEGIGYRKSRPESLANAKLIAAAPDLLNTCIEVLSCLKNAPHREYERNLLETIIKKATT